ncbi:hypothetical protein HVE01_02230 [Vreelandella venusta]|nr:hypothetical protein HVE01_02230 [Halomonas venusta]
MEWLGPVAGSGIVYYTRKAAGVQLDEQQLAAVRDEIADVQLYLIRLNLDSSRVGDSAFGLNSSLKTSFNGVSVLEDKPFTAQPVWCRGDDRLAGVTRRHI